MTEDILEAIGKIFAIIGIGLLTALAVAVLAYCFLGWILPIIAFLHGKATLGLVLLIVWMIVSGARISI